MTAHVPSETVGNPTLEFLTWLDVRRRTYAETMEAWQTSCPRFSVWEDSLIDGLICLEARTPAASSVVTLTPRGRAILDAAKPNDIDESM